MPHCTIEYSESVTDHISIEKVMNTVFQAAEKSELFQSDDIKVRALKYQHFLLAESYNDFIHVVLKLLSGRTLHQRQQLSSQTIKALKALELRNTSITVEVVNLEKESYFKL